MPAAADSVEPCGPWRPGRRRQARPHVARLLEVDGELVATAAGAKVLGHQAHAIAVFANELTPRGTTLTAGSIVPSGGLSAAGALGTGRHVTATWGRLGSLTVHGGRHAPHPGPPRRRPDARPERALLNAPTEAAHTALGAARSSSIRVWIIEVAPDGYVAGGELLADKRARTTS